MDKEIQKEGIKNFENNKNIPNKKDIRRNSLESKIKAIKKDTVVNNVTSLIDSVCYDFGPHFKKDNDDKRILNYDCFKRCFSNIFDIIKKTSHEKYDNTRLSCTDEKILFAENLLDCIKNLDDLETKEKEDIKQLRNSFIHLIESYTVLVAQLTNVIEFKEIGNTQNLYNLHSKILTSLQVRTLINEHTQKNIEHAFYTMREIRNQQAHNPIIKTPLANKIEIINILIYIGMLNWAYKFLYITRYGGIRFKTSTAGNITFYINEESKNTCTIKNNSKNDSIKFIYLEDKAKDSDKYKLIFEPENGDDVKEYFPEFKGNSICEIEFSQDSSETNIINEPIGQTISKNENIDNEEISRIGIQVPKTKSVLKLQEIKRTKFKNGYIIGSFDNTLGPNGFYNFELNQDYYSGTFENGKPVGVFEIINKNNPYLYRYEGTIKDDFTLNKGKLNYIKENKIYEGVFNGFWCICGKYYKEGILRYEGSFKIIPLENGQETIVYDGKGVMYEDTFTYEGEFDKNQFNGYGIKKYKNGITPPEEGYWLNNMLIERNISNTDSDSQIIELFILNQDLSIQIYKETQCLVELDNCCGYLSIEKGTSLSVKSSRNQLVEKISPFVVTNASDEVLTWDIQKEYEDLLVDSKQNQTVGEAEFVDENGNKYKGEVNYEGKPHGKGFLNNTDFSYEGFFINGKFHGKGILIDKLSNKIFSGNFKNGKKEGLFVIQDKFGNKIEKNY